MRLCLCAVIDFPGAWNQKSSFYGIVWCGMAPKRLLTMVSIVEKSWAKAKALGAETIGVMLFKNIFEMAPQALPGLECFPGTTP